MSVTRLVVAGQPIAVGERAVPPDAAHHARVARILPGDPVELLDLAGTVGVGRLIAWEGKICRVAVERVDRGRGEPPAPLVLGLAVLHTAAFDWAVEKATELGATRIVPVTSERSQGGRHEGRRERWQRIAAAAVAQCGRSCAPSVEPLTTLDAFVASAAGVRLVAAPGACEVGRLAAGPAGVSLLVGPEGGLTESEVAAALSAGFVPLPLGSRILRAETAALAALAVAQDRLGWLVGGAQTSA